MTSWPIIRPFAPGKNDSKGRNRPMKPDERNDSTFFEEDPFAPPAWLLVALRTVDDEPEEAFQAACVRSAETALALAKLRQASQRTRFSLLSVPALLRSLAAIACVPLEPVVQW